MMINLGVMLEMGQNEEYVALQDKMHSLIEERDSLHVHYYREGMDPSELTEDDRKFDKIESQIQDIMYQMQNLIDAAK